MIYFLVDCFSLNFQSGGDLIEFVELLGLFFNKWIFHKIYSIRLILKSRDQVGEVHVRILLKLIFHHYQHHTFQISLLSIFLKKHFQELDEDFRCSRNLFSPSQRIHKVPSSDEYRIWVGFFSYFLHCFYWLWSFYLGWSFYCILHSKMKLSPCAWAWDSGTVLWLNLKIRPCQTVSCQENWISLQLYFSYGCISLDWRNLKNPQ